MGREMDQLDFFGGALARKLNPESTYSSFDRERWYFSIMPPPALAQDIERAATLVARRCGARYPTRADRLHVSLNGIWRSPDEIEPALVEDALEVGAAIRRPGFELSFDTLLTFSAGSRSRTGGRTFVPTVLTCSNGARELLALHADIRREMQRLGMPIGPKAFTPHLTVWYGPERVPALLLRRPFRWSVRKFWLVHTVKGQRRPDYVGEWSLG